jgi:hypothetical protein
MIDTARWGLRCRSSPRLRSEAPAGLEGQPEGLRWLRWFTAGRAELNKQEKTTSPTGAYSTIVAQAPGSRAKPLRGWKVSPKGFAD